jgi:hypothetical protein
MQISAFQSGVQGVQRAERQFEKSASDVSAAFSISLSPEAQSGLAPDPVQAMVGGLTAVAAYRANLKTLQTADDISGVVMGLVGSR